MINIGEPLWLSGKVMKWENEQNQKIPGSPPTLPGQLRKYKHHVNKGKNGQIYFFLM
jgi:hypothetical protein